MDRRDFLRLLFTGTAAMGTVLGRVGPFSVQALAAAVPGRVLVVIFQRGGCDGLNLCVPFGDDGYYSARPALAIPPPGGSEGALALDNFFGFHPQMPGLYQLYQEGAVAVFPAVHYPDASRSHFDSEIIIESGSDHKLYSGWLNRYLSRDEGAAGALRAAGFGDSLAHSLHGEASAAVFSDMSSSSLGRGREDFREELRRNLRNIFAEPVGQPRKNLELLHKQGSIMLDNLSLMESVRTGHYVPDNSAEYPDGGFGRQLMNAAQLIKSGIGLEVVCIDTGGWDTHSDQASRQARRLREFSEGLAAFYKDLGSFRQDVLILAMTEFGRTVRENASHGTDHGNASAWLAIGGRVKGGVFGQWPGLGTDRLYLGRYLDFSIDYRNIFAEALKLHLSCPDLSGILPDFQPEPLGYL